MNDPARVDQGSCPDPDRSAAELLADCPDIVYRLDAAGRPVWANGALERLLGYRLEEFAAPGFDFAALVHPDDRDRAALELRLVRAGRSGKDFEVRLLPRGAAEHVWFSNLTYPLRDAAGAVTGYGGVARDVTRAVHTAASLARRNFELIAINAISLAVQGTLDLESRLRNFAAALARALSLDGSGAFFRVTAFPAAPLLCFDDAGLTLRALCGEPGGVLLSPHDRIEVLRDDRPLPFPCPAAARAFAAGFRACLYLPLSLDAFGTGAVFLFARDPAGFDGASSALLSTARMQLCAALENAVRHLVEARRVTVITVLKETASALINAGDMAELLTATHYQARRYLPLDRIALTVMTCAETAVCHGSGSPSPIPDNGRLYRLDDPAYPFFGRLALREPEYIHDLESIGDGRFAAPRAAGMRTLLDVPLPLSPDRSGCIRFLAAAPDAFHPEERDFLRDLARIVALAVANLLLKDELKRQTELAEAKNAELQTFVYSVSHDLKTPLFSIIGLAGILREELPADDPRDAYLVRLVDNAARMDAQIKELVTLSKIGTYTPVPERLDLAELFRVAVRSLEVKMRERGAAVTVAAEATDVVADRALLARVIENLLDNAIKYVPRGRNPKVELSARTLLTPSGARMRIEVRDNGCGIAERDRERVFALFSRLKVLPEVDGTGAGLSIVRRMVERLGGTIELMSVEGEGSLFRVDLPAGTP